MWLLLLLSVPDIIGFSLVAQLGKNPPVMWETQVRSLVWEIPWRRKWQPTSVFLAAKSHGQKSLVGYNPSTLHGVTNSWIQLSDYTTTTRYYKSLTERQN